MEAIVALGIGWVYWGVSLVAFVEGGYYFDALLFLSTSYVVVRGSGETIMSGTPSAERQPLQQMGARGTLWVLLARCADAGNA